MTDGAGTISLKGEIRFEFMKARISGRYKIPLFRLCTEVNSEAIDFHAASESLEIYIQFRFQYPFDYFDQLCLCHCCSLFVAETLWFIWTERSLDNCNRQ